MGRLTRVGDWAAFLCTLALWVPSRAPAQTVYEGDYLNLSFAGDGSTPSAMTLFEAQERAASAPRASGQASDTGDFSWSVPIPLPPALLQPELGIAYSSAAGHHTWISRGWEIQAGMSIHRIEGVEATHAYADLPDAHRVASGGLDGLVFPDGTGGEWLYASTGPIDARFERFGDTWTVSHGGITTWLEPDLTDPGGWPTTWHTVRARDASGNTVDYDWDGSRLVAVQYGGATDPGGAMLPGQPHLVEIRFLYGPREHASLQVRGGTLEVIDEHLDRVEVATTFVTGTLRPEVELVLSYADQRGEDALASIVRQASGGGSAVTVARLYYAPYVSNAGSAVTVEDGPSAISTGQTVVRGYRYPSATDTLTGQYDYSGDGLLDVLVGVGSLWDVEALAWASDDTATWDAPQDFAPPMILACGLDWTRFPELGCEDRSGSLERTYTLRCGEQQSISYSTRRLVDVDGDGFLDLVETDREVDRAPYDPREAVAVDFCAERYASSGTAWFTIHYGDRDGLDAVAVSVPSPVDYPRVGQGLVTKDMLVDSIPPTSPGEDAVVDMLDVNGDGWLDIVSVVPWTAGSSFSLDVALHQGGRDGGWAAPVRMSAGTPELEGVLGSLESSTQYVNTAILSVYDRWRQETPQIHQVEVTKAFRDLNGDGLLDYVDATKRTTGPGWSVWFGTGRDDEQGFVGPFSWVAPLTYLGLSDEGQARVMSCRVTDGGQGGAVAGDPNLDVDTLWEAIDGNIFGEAPFDPGGELPTLGCSGLGGEPGNGLLDLGAPQRRIVGLLDMDGDGRDDLVDTRVGWWRNLGDGFSTAMNSLPAFFPDALDASMVRTIVVSDGGALLGDAPPAEGEHVIHPSRSTRHGVYAVLDLDRDGLPDVIDIGDPDDDNAVPTVTYHPRGRARPGLLVRVDTAFGATTTIAYTATSRMEPAGIVGTLQEMAAHRDVATRIEVIDPVTGFEGEQVYEYSDGRCI